MLNDTFNADTESPYSSYMTKQWNSEHQTSTYALIYCFTISFFDILIPSFQLCCWKDSKMFAESCIFESALIWYVNCLVGGCYLTVHLQESLSLKLFTFQMQYGKMQVYCCYATALGVMPSNSWKGCCFSASLLPKRS